MASKPRDWVPTAFSAALLALCAQVLFVLLALLALTMLNPGRASAQTPYISGQLALGSGITWGNGPADSTVSRRSPMLVDLSARTWSDEVQNIIWGGSVRLEIEGRTSIAIVPRVEMSKKLGSLSVLPGVGVPLFFSPFSMLGIELSTCVLMPLSDVFSLSGTAMFDGFFFGSDVPNDSAVIMFNLMLGATIAL